MTTDKNLGRSYEEWQIMTKEIALQTIDNARKLFISWGFIESLRLLQSVINTMLPNHFSDLKKLAWYQEEVVMLKFRRENYDASPQSYDNYESPKMNHALVELIWLFERFVQEYTGWFNFISEKSQAIGRVSEASQWILQTFLTPLEVMTRRIQIELDAQVQANKLLQVKNDQQAVLIAKLQATINRTQWPVEKPADEIENVKRTFPMLKIDYSLADSYKAYLVWRHVDSQALEDETRIMDVLNKLYWFVQDDARCRDIYNQLILFGGRINQEYKAKRMWVNNQQVIDGLFVECLSFIDKIQWVGVKFL